MVPARLYFCKLCSLAYDFQSTEECGRSCTEHWTQPSKQGPEHRGCARAADKALRWSQGFSGRAPRPGSPGATDSNTFTLEHPRSGGEADISGTAPSARCCLWEQQGTTAVARQLHEKPIASNPVRKTQPLGKHGTPWCVPGRSGCWMSALEKNPICISG